MSVLAQFERETKTNTWFDYQLVYWEIGTIDSESFIRRRRRKWQYGRNCESRIPWDYRLDESDLFHGQLFYLYPSRIALAEILFCLKNSCLQHVSSLYFTSREGNRNRGLNRRSNSRRSSRARTSQPLVAIDHQDLSREKRSRELHLTVSDPAFLS